MTAITTQTIAKTISDLVPDELRTESAELAREVRALIPLIAPLVARSQALSLELERIGLEQSESLTEAVSTDDRNEAADGWGRMWHHLSGEMVVSAAFYELLEVVEAHEARGNSGADA